MGSKARALGHITPEARSQYKEMLRGNRRGVEAHAGNRPNGGGEVFLGMVLNGKSRKAHPRNVLGPLFLATLGEGVERAGDSHNGQYLWFA